MKGACYGNNVVQVIALREPRSKKDATDMYIIGYVRLVHC